MKVLSNVFAIRVVARFLGFRTRDPHRICRVIYTLSKKTNLCSVQASHFLHNPISPLTLHCSTPARPP